MKAYYVNRSDRDDRHYLFCGAMAAAGFRPDELVRVDAMKREDYPTREAVCNAGAADGFPEFFTYQRDKTWPEYNHMIGSWSMMRSWRMIAEQDDIGIHFVDDYYLRKQKWELESLIEPLNDLSILQLAWHERTDVFLLNKYDLPIPFEMEADVISEKQPQVLRGAAHGCSDWAILMTPEGAQALLKYQREHPYVNPELSVTAMYSTFRQMTGIYSLKDQNRYKSGLEVLLPEDNPWIGHLAEYTDKDMSNFGWGGEQ